MKVKLISRILNKVVWNIKNDDFIRRYLLFSKLGQKPRQRSKTMELQHKLVDFSVWNICLHSSNFRQYWKEKEYVIILKAKLRNLLKAIGSKYSGEIMNVHAILHMVFGYFCQELAQVLEEAVVRVWQLFY